MKTTAEINGVRVITTSELSKRLGMTVSSTAISDLNVVKPHAETATGIYWREDDFGVIALALAQKFLKVGMMEEWSKNLQSRGLIKRRPSQVEAA